MLLVKVIPDSHVDRWYLVIVQPTLLDQAAVICAWGSRRSSYQQARIIPVATAEEAQALADKIIAKKLKRGYYVSGSPPKTGT